MPVNFHGHLYFISALSNDYLQVVTFCSRRVKITQVNAKTHLEEYLSGLNLLQNHECWSASQKNFFEKSWQNSNYRIWLFWNKFL